MELVDIQMDEKMLLGDLQELISINSVNPHLDKDGPGEREIAVFLKDLVNKMGFEVTLQDLGSNRFNLIAVLRGSGGGKTLLLNGHMDTVDTKGMTIDPFHPLFKDGKVYGRGSLDMKGGLAAILSAARSVKSTGTVLRGDLVITFVADEEYKSIGTEAVAETCSADGAIVCEPTDLQLVLAHKGFTWERITFHGKAAHGSRPCEGIDAITNAGKFLTRLDRFSGDVLGKRYHPLLGRPSLHASSIKGGIGISTYPDLCVLEMERRTLPGETALQVSGEIRNILQDMELSDPNFMAEHEQFFIRNALETDVDNLLVRNLKQAWKQTMGSQSKIGGFSGWADSAILNDKGIPSVNFGPSGKGLHAAEEYVEFQSVVDCAKVLAHTIISYCS